MKRNLLFTFICSVLLAGAFWLGRRSVWPIIETIETVRTDTIYRERPVPVAVTSRPISVNVPRLVFMRADTTHTMISATDSVATGAPKIIDSVAAAIEIQMLEYRDSTYYARVVGPKIGTYCPRLDYIETYSRTWTIRETVTKRNRFAVTAGAGVAWTPEGIRPTVGVQVGVVLWGW